jgi:K+-sensing histidine kinase KdpD
VTIDTRAWLPRGRRGLALGLVTVAIALGITTLAIAALEGWIGVADASAAYLLAVVACAVLLGSWAAVLASFGAFLLYDFFFIDPRHTLTVSDPGEWPSSRPPSGAAREQPRRGSARPGRCSG